MNNLLVIKEKKHHFSSFTSEKVALFQIWAKQCFMRSTSLNFMFKSQAKHKPSSFWLSIQLLPVGQWMLWTVIYTQSWTRYQLILKSNLLVHMVWRPFTGIILLTPIKFPSQRNLYFKKTDTIVYSQYIFREFILNWELQRRLGPSSNPLRQCMRIKPCGEIWIEIVEQPCWAMI